MGQWKLAFSEQARNAMEGRGIREEDVREVLEYAEESGAYLREKGGEALLAKKRIGNFTVYVECVKGDGFEIRDAYSHRVMLAEDRNP